MNSRILFAVACLGLANAVKLAQSDFELPEFLDMPEMGGDMGGVTDEAIDESGAYWTGEYGDFTAGDGTRFVTGAEEEDDEAPPVSWLASIGAADGAPLTTPGISSVGSCGKLKPQP